MLIRAGTHNKAKLSAIQNVFPEAYIESSSVSSHVSAQPVSNEETRIGAINRAQQCADEATQSYGIGLEGGVMVVDGSLYLCNWGALETPSGDLLTASGAAIALPASFEVLLEGKRELGDMMDDYVQHKHVSRNEGAIGVFTNGVLQRSDMFTHIVLLLSGQLDYQKK